VLRASLAIPTVLWPATAAAADGSYRLDGGQIFTLLFVTLGPLKILGPFARLTRAFEPSSCGGSPGDPRPSRRSRCSSAGFWVVRSSAAGGFHHPCCR
jgi:hypothetical protein